MWNLRYDTNELMYQRETDSQTQKIVSWVPRRTEEAWTGSVGLADANYYIQDR